MKEDRIFLLIARKAAGEASEEEVRELEELIRTDPEIQFTVDNFFKLWNAVPKKQTAETNVKKLMQRIKQKDTFRIGDEQGREIYNFSKKNFMIKNYFKIAWRNIVRRRAYTAINVLGLALGLCACLVIYLITSYEFSFDRFHPDKERIYRMTGELLRNNGEKEFLNCTISDVAGIEHDIPGFESKAGLFYYDAKINIPGADIKEKEFHSNSDVIVTWPAFFDIFKYDWLAGNAATALNEPYKVVLSELKARKYFGNGSLEKMIGKTVVYNDSLPLTVSGIVKDWKGHTDFPFADFISISTASGGFLKKEIPTPDWNSLHPHGAMAFVKLNKDIEVADINAKLNAYAKKKAKRSGFGKLLSLQLQPLTDIHFTHDYYRGDDGDSFRKAHLPTLYALLGIALFVLIIAAINFINLSTAQSIQRSKEVGVRKVLGSGRKNLVFQFLAETFVLTLIAIIISLLFVNPVLSLFSSFIPKGIVFDPFNSSTLIFLFALLVTTTLLAGFYPAKVLSSHLPVLSLKGVVGTSGHRGTNLRKALIVFQFTISLVFIIGTLVIGNQLKFMRSKDKGFKTDAIITVNNWRDQSGRMKVLAEKIKQLPGVDKVIAQCIPPMGFADMSFNYTHKGKNELHLEVSTKMGNDEFIPFYKMKILAGRNMVHSDSLQELVINEAFSKVLGFKKPADAIGAFLFQDNKPYPIVGVIADFHQGSFHDPIKPVVIAHMPEWESSLAIGLLTKGRQVSDTKPVITAIEKEWKALYPEAGINYSFLDQSIGWLFEKDQQTAWLMNVATIITIFISCMGLFGLAMFTAQRRTKEIGIRKVLGASVLNITSMLSKDFVIQVTLAILIASPLAWFFMNRWLQDFAYRTTISWWIFALAGIIALAIALVTVSFQAIKVAVANPASSLRTE
ncbi:MAG: ABC transporter permease [Chitinophagaceae bacterium]